MPTATQPVDAASGFRDDRRKRQPTRHSMAVWAVGARDLVAVPERSADAGR